MAGLAARLQLLECQVPDMAWLHTVFNHFVIVNAQSSLIIARLVFMVVHVLYICYDIASVNLYPKCIVYKRIFSLQLRKIWFAYFPSSVGRSHDINWTRYYFTISFLLSYSAIIWFFPRFFIMLTVKFFYLRYKCQLFEIKMFK